MGRKRSLYVHEAKNGVSISRERIPGALKLAGLLGMIRDRLETEAPDVSAQDDKVITAFCKAFHVVVTNHPSDVANLYASKKTEGKRWGNAKSKTLTRIPLLTYANSGNRAASVADLDDWPELAEAIDSVVAAAQS